jgi:uncharacterized membrane protein
MLKGIGLEKFSVICVEKFNMFKNINKSVFWDCAVKNIICLLFCLLISIGLLHSEIDSWTIFGFVIGFALFMFWDREKFTLKGN